MQRYCNTVSCFNVAHSSRRGHYKHGRYFVRRLTSRLCQTFSLDDRWGSVRRYSALPWVWFHIFQLIPSRHVPYLNKVQAVFPFRSWTRVTASKHAELSGKGVTSDRGRANNVRVPWGCGTLLHLLPQRTEWLSSVIFRRREFEVSYRKSYSKTPLEVLRWEHCGRYLLKICVYAVWIIRKLAGGVRSSGMLCCVDWKIITALRRVVVPSKRR